jgi:hypothetical protein
MLNSMMSPNAAGRPGMVDVANTLPSLHAAAHDLLPNSATQVIARQRSPALTGTAAAAGDTLAFPVPPPGNRPVPPPTDRERHRFWPPIVAVVIVVALGAVLAMVLLSGSGGSNNAPRGLASSALSRSPSPSPSPSPSRSASKSESDPVTKTPTPSAPIQNGPPTNRELANAVVDYFNLVPGNLDAGWARLTPHFQRTKAQNRQTYDNFWNSVKRVSVISVHGEPPNHATATLSYQYKDGRVVTQRTRFHLVRQGGTLKIDGES